MADDLALLFKLKADPSGAKAGITEVKAAVSSLKASFGADLGAMQTASATALSSISTNLNAFVGARLPVVGGAFVRISESLIALGAKATTVSPEVSKLASDILNLSEVSGKSASEVGAFLKTFNQLEGAAARNAAAIDFFGGKTDAFTGEVKANFTPELEKAAAQLVTTSAAAESSVGPMARLGAAFGGMAIPIAATVAALAAALVVLYQIESELIKDATAFSKYGDELDRASQKTKLTVEQLSALRVVAKDTNVPFDTLVSALGRYLKSVDAAASGNKELRDELESLGIDAEQAARNPQQAILQLFQAYERLGPSIAENTVLSKLLGRSGIDLIPVLRAINGNLDEASARAKRFGLSMSADAVKGATELDNALDDLSDQWEGIKLGIGEGAAPAVTDLVNAFVNLLNTSKPLFNIIGAIGIPIMNQLTAATRGLSTIVAISTGNYEELIRQHYAFREAVEKPIAPVSIPVDKGPTPPTETETAEKRLSDLQRFGAEARRLAKEGSAEVSTLVTLGQETERTLTKTLVNEAKTRGASRRGEIEAAIDLKYAELRALDAADSEHAKKVKEANDKIDDLRQQQRDSESDEKAEISKINSDFQAKQRADNLAFELAKSEIAEAGARTRIRIADFEVREGLKTAEEGEAAKEKIENEIYTKRKAALERALKLAGAEPSAQRKANLELERLEKTHAETRQDQLERRTAIAEQAAARERAIQLDLAQTTLRIEQIRDTAQIAAIKALASARVKTEEDAGNEILKVRLAAIDRETKAIQERLAGTGSIKDKGERAKAEAEFNNQLKVKAAEKKAIEEEGTRDAETNRQKDLANERRYNNELLDLKDKITAIQRESARVVIEMLVFQHSSRREIIKQQRTLDLLEEDDRHQRAEDSIKAQIAENRESTRTKQQKLDREKELNKLLEAEDKRHKLETGIINTKADTADKEAERTADRATPLGKFKIDAQDIEDFAEELEKSIVPLNQILKESFYQVAEAIGSVVEQWVLYGETGPAVMRKILATALATIAKEAAINAIKELAVGFALLAIGDPGAGSAFLSAALWGGIAGVSALAGRGIAGDTFKKAGGSAGGEDRKEPGSGQLNPLTQGRNQPQPQIIILRPEVKVETRHIIQVAPNSGEFAKAITATIVDDYQQNGVTYKIIEGGDSTT